MTKRLKIELRRSEIRSRLNEIRGMAEAERTAEVRAEAERLEAELTASEVELRAAIEAEDAELRQRGNQANGDGESAELRELRGRVTLAAYFGAAVESRAVDGAELEFNQALGIPAGRFPLELLAPREERATTDVDAAATQRTWLDRLFSETAAMYAGVTFENVAPGVSAHPVVTAGASAAQRGRDEAAADAAWTVGVEEIKPSRNAVRATFNEVDAARLPGLEDALRRDLRMALTEGIDRAIFIGDAGANENGADITGLQTAAGVVEITLSQANKIKGVETLAQFAGLLDGKHASMLSGLRVVASVGANTLWLSTNVSGASAQPLTLAKWLMDAGLSWRVRGDLAAASGNGAFGAFIGRAAGIAGAAVAAVWNSAAMIRDPYSEAAKGEVALTLSTLWGFKLPRPSNFARLKFVA